MKKNKSRVFGSLIGVAVGDALGVPLEFMSAEQIRKKYGGNVKEMVGGGWLNVAPGEITDDTQMTLAVAEGIVENPDNPIPAIGQRFIEWYDNNPKDIGNCCRAVITYAKENGAVDFQGWFKAAQQVHKNTGGQTAGNGALMRAVYPALWYGVEAHTIAEQIGYMTHVHEHSNLSVISYTKAIAELIKQEPVIALGKESIAYYLEPIRDIIKHKKLEPDGYAPNSLVCAANAIRDTDSFEDALVYAVNLGGDADTIGAITGGLAGALYGVEAIPKRWINALDKAIMEQIERLAEKACIR